MIKKKDRRKKVMLVIGIIAVLLIVLAIFLINTKNEYTMKYNKVIEDLVKDYFPELADKKIIVIERHFLGRGSGSAFPFPRIITLSTKVRNYSEDSVKGLLAHELAHIDNNREKHKNPLYFIRWFFDKKVQASYEKEADEKVIEVGLGKYLLASAFTDQIGHTPEELVERYTVKGYLSPAEIIQQIEARKAG